MELKPIIVCSNFDPGFTLIYFTAGSNFVTKAIGKSKNSGFFSETIAASDMKVSRSRHLLKYMNIYEY